MQIIENEVFSRIYDRGGRLQIEDLAVSSCIFESCALSLTQDFSRISTFKRISLTDCSINGCETGPAIYSNIRIHNLRINDLLIFWCPFLEEVSFSGNIGKIKINAIADPSAYGSEWQKVFDDYRNTFYEKVEWALDISDARFKGFEIRGVPGQKIRRDPESQVLINRKRALEIVSPGWDRSLELKNTIWPFSIDLFLSGGDPDVVLVVPLGAPKAKRDLLMKGIKELRSIGLAEPD